MRSLFRHRSWAVRLQAGAVLALALATAACSGRSSTAKAGSGPQAMPVKIQTATLQRVGDFTEYLATLKSRRSSVLQPQVEGQVVRIFVHSGDDVKAGQPLLEIDPIKQQATVNSQEAAQRSKLAALQYNRDELERRKKLFQAGVISKQDLDQAQTAYDASVADVQATEATVREQQVQLHYYTVKAPENGMLGDIPVRVGDRVTNATVLTTLDTGGDLEAYISVPAEKSGAVHVGMPVDIVADDGKPPVRTRITFASPRVDPATQLLLIKAAVPNADHRFRNDETVHAQVIWRELELPTIPVTAVSRISGQTFAFVADGNGNQVVARQRTVRLGDIVGNDYVVLDGIKSGDRVIVSGTQMLADGVPVAPES